MIRFTDLTCYFNKEFIEPGELISRQEESLGYTWFLQERLSIEVIKHAAFEGIRVINKVKFYFFKGSNRFGYFSAETMRYLRSHPPDIVLFQGLIFPVQLLRLRFLLGKKPVIIVQHHGEQPFPWYKKWMQQWADKCINAYIFTSLGNAGIWLKSNIISNPGKCFEIEEASTRFVRQDKAESKLKLSLTGDWNFLWVGRLNANKDPLTVLRGFEKYLEDNSSSKLYMIFQTDELLNELNQLVNKNEALKKAVYFIGKIDHGDLLHWYSAADFFISGSHREGSGFALIEAMSCGCIPVITDIPTFKKITDNGGLAILYEAGNSNQLYDSLQTLQYLAREEMSAAIVEYFNKELSFKAIADKIYNLTSILTRI